MDGGHTYSYTIIFVRKDQCVSFVQYPGKYFSFVPQLSGQNLFAKNLKPGEEKLVKKEVSDKFV